jgi:uncharacterized protein YndB with AHSA1/START domain
MNIATKPLTELFLTRELDAPRERVYAAWTDPRQAARWWAPKGFTSLACEMDVRPGGIWRREIRTPDGKLVVKHGLYREIVPPERLVFTYITEHTGGVIDPETLVTVTFADLGDGRTRLTLHHSAFETETARDAHRGGWTSALDRLPTFVAGQR